MLQWSYHAWNKLVFGLTRISVVFVGLAFLASFLPTVAFADTDSECAKVLLPTSVEYVNTYEKAVALILSINSDEDLRKSTSIVSSATFPISGIPVQATGNYNAFSEWRKTWQSNFHFNLNESQKSFLRTSYFTDAQVKAWSDCIGTGGLKVRIVQWTSRNIEMEVEYRPTDNSLADSYGVVIGAPQGGRLEAPSSTLDRRPAHRGYLKGGLIYSRTPNQDFLLQISVGQGPNNTKSLYIPWLPVPEPQPNFVSCGEINPHILGRAFSDSLPKFPPKTSAIDGVEALQPGQWAKTIGEGYPNNGGGFGDAKVTVSCAILEQTPKSIHMVMDVSSYAHAVSGGPRAEDDTGGANAGGEGIANPDWQTTLTIPANPQQMWKLNIVSTISGSSRPCFTTVDGVDSANIFVAGSQTRTVDLKGGAHRIGFHCSNGNISFLAGQGQHQQVSRSDAAHLDISAAPVSTAR